MKQVTVTLDNVDFTVWGYFSKELLSNDYDTPSDGNEFDMHEVYNGDDNIIEFLSDIVVDQLSYLALNQLTNN